MKIVLIIFGGYFILGIFTLFLRYQFELWIWGTGTWSTERQNWELGILIWPVVLISIPWIIITDIIDKIIKRL
jgi:hypothetical protein